MSIGVHLRRGVVLLALLVAPAGAQRATPSSTAPLDSAQSYGGALIAPVTLTSNGMTRRAVIAAIASQANVNIVFDAGLPALDDVIAPRYAALPAATALLRALDGAGLRALASPSGQVVLVPLPAHGLMRRVTGRVRSAEGPVAAARVELLGTGRGTLTHDDGSFALGPVPAGDYLVRVTRLGYEPVRGYAVHVTGDDDARAEVTMKRRAQSLDAVVVTPGFHGLLDSPDGTLQSLSREQLATVPQIGEDIYRAINRLPGVESSDFSARFAVRGAGADQLHVTLDGLRLIEPFHLKDIGSALSIIDIQTLGDASLTTGGAGAAYGDHTGGVLEMRSLDPRADQPHSAVGISITNLRGSSQGAFAGGRGGWLVSGRRGFLDLAFRLTNFADSLSPRYNDAFAKVQYDLPGGGTVAMHALHAADALRYLDTGEELIESRYLSDYAWTTRRQPIGARLTASTVASLGWLDWRRRGRTSSRVNPVANVDDGRTLRTAELRQDLTLSVSARHLLAFGVDVHDDRAVYAYDRDARRGIYVDGIFTTITETVRDRLVSSGTSVGWYATERVQPLDAVTVEVGVRADRAAGSGERIVDPRANVAWRASEGTTLRGAWGRYSQAQPIFALSFQDGEHTFSPADRSEQVELGLERRIAAGTSLRINAYQRLQRAEWPRYVSMSSGINSFPEISWDRVRIQPDSGRAHGVEATLARAGATTGDWSASYALSEATAYIAGRVVPRGTDQRHAVHLDWAFHPASNSWRLAIAGTWHSGTPYTPELVSVDTVVDTPSQFTVNAQWAPGDTYSRRLPAYHRLDIRWTRYFTTSRGRIAMFGELYNALNRGNVRGYYTNVALNNRTISYSRGTRELLPRLPSLGVSWEF